MTTRSPEASETSLATDLLYALRYYLGGRRGLLVLGGIALATALALNWGWLVAVGIAPLLLAVLPCVAMCALGLCMNRMGGRSCSTEAAKDAVAGSSGDEVRTIPPDRGQQAFLTADAIKTDGIPATAPEPLPGPPKE